MKYAVLPNAKVVMSTDGNKNLFIDTGSGLIPIQEKNYGTETRRITFDGNVEGREVTSDGLVKISDECIDPSSISSIRVFRKATYAYEKDCIYTLTPDIFTVHRQANAAVISAQIETQIFLFLVTIVYEAGEGFTRGTYTTTPDIVSYYATEIVYDHVTKLDSKYAPDVIPIVTVPLVEMDEESGTAPIGEPAAAAFRNAYNANVPMLLLNIAAPGVSINYVCTRVSFEDSVQGYQFTDIYPMLIVVTDAEVFFLDPQQ